MFSFARLSAAAATPPLPPQPMQATANCPLYPRFKRSPPHRVLLARRAFSGTPDPPFSPFSYSSCPGKKGGAPRHRPHAEGVAAAQPAPPPPPLLPLPNRPPCLTAGCRPLGTLSPLSVCIVLLSPPPRSSVQTTQLLGRPEGAARGPAFLCPACCPFASILLPCRFAHALGSCTQPPPGPN